MIELKMRLLQDVGIIDGTMNHDEAMEIINRNEYHGYLTENTGRDGKDYLWYFDGTMEKIMEIETGKILYEISENEIDYLFL